MKSSEIAAKLKYHIEHHFVEIRTLAECANAVGKSYHYAARCFRREYGKSPEEHLILLRIEQSKVLLLETHMPIIDVIVRVGARDDIWFRKTFRERVGYTMSAYRKNHDAEHKRRANK